MAAQINVEHYMTRSPYTIGQEQTLAAAHDLMRIHQIRHLPVLHGGRVVGMVSMRDLHLVETLPDVNPEHITVEDAMTGDPYRVAPQASLCEVAREMAEKRLGSAIVVEGNKVVGVFTTVDALTALADVLGKD